MLNVATAATRPAVAQLARAITLVANEVTRTGVPVVGIQANTSSPYGRHGLVSVAVHVASLTAGGPGEAGAAQVASLWGLPKVDDGNSNMDWRGEWPLMGIYVQVFTGRDPQPSTPRDCEVCE